MADRIRYFAGNLAHGVFEGGGGFKRVRKSRVLVRKSGGVKGSKRCSKN